MKLRENHSGMETKYEASIRRNIKKLRENHSGMETRFKLDRE